MSIYRARGSTWVSAISGLGNDTIVAAQAPTSEANVAPSYKRIEVDGADSLPIMVSSTRLPATCTQIPIGSLQATIPSSSRGSEPMYLSALHPLGAEASSRIPTIYTLYFKYFQKVFCTTLRVAFRHASLDDTRDGHSRGPVTSL